jgi:hypothetical protein
MRACSATQTHHTCISCWLFLGLAANGNHVVPGSKLKTCTLELTLASRADFACRVKRALLITVCMQRTERCRDALVASCSGAQLRAGTRRGVDQGKKGVRTWVPRSVTWPTSPSGDWITHSYVLDRRAVSVSPTALPALQGYLRLCRITSGGAPVLNTAASPLLNISPQRRAHYY